MTIALLVALAGSLVLLVVNGLMRVALDTGVPVLSVSLTPHHFQPTEHHIGVFAKHFVEKGREAYREGGPRGLVRKSMGLLNTCSVSPNSTTWPGLPSSAKKKAVREETRWACCML